MDETSETAVQGVPEDTQLTMTATARAWADMTQQTLRFAGEAKQRMWKARDAAHNMRVALASMESEVKQAERDYEEARVMLQGSWETLRGELKNLPVRNQQAAS